nr:MAG TPA: hypothetical protein [Caudoviricetes sp.]
MQIVAPHPHDSRKALATNGLSVGICSPQHPTATHI